MRGVGYLRCILMVDLAVGLLEILLFGQYSRPLEIDPLSWCLCSWPLKFHFQHYLTPRLFSHLDAQNVSVLFFGIKDCDTYQSSNPRVVVAFERGIK